MQRNTLPLTIEQEQTSPDILQSDSRESETLNQSGENAAPRILLTATLRWPIAARLAIAFANIGCHVEVACPHHHPAHKTHAVHRIHFYGTLKPLASLRTAIQSAAPDLIIPCDDSAATHLHQLYADTRTTTPSSIALRRLIAYSLGTPGVCTLATARGEFMALAAELGVQVPHTTVISSNREFGIWLLKHPLPAVIKMDCSWGGLGTVIVRTPEEAWHAYKTMATRPSIINVLTRTLLDRDPSIFLKAVKPVQPVITLQEFIPGTPANRAVACWQGQVLGGISVEALKTQHATGPATVARVIEHPQMTDTAAQLVRRLGISGLWGLDFILEAGTGNAYLIEMNPRATPICHLPLGAGQNLPVALYTQLTGHPPLTPATNIPQDVIAMFPGEWRRDPASPYLYSAYYDIPWDETELTLECIRRPWSERGLLARLWALLRGHISRRPLQSAVLSRAPGNKTRAAGNKKTADNKLAVRGFKYLPSSLVDKKTRLSD